MSHQKSPSRGGIYPIMCRGVRGATTVTENTGDAILEATRTLEAPFTGDAVLWLKASGR